MTDTMVPADVPLFLPVHLMQHWSEVYIVIITHNTMLALVLYVLWFTVIVL